MTAERLLHLSLEAVPESIGAARRRVGELAISLEMAEPTLGDLKTVVSEACSNVVQHAYPGKAGIFEVEAFADEKGMAVVVRDFGRGIRARIESEESSLQLGLGLISMLTTDFDISGRHAGGTEVRMVLPLSA
jgi:serine/threonine-protein kinase RsbW